MIILVCSIILVELENCKLFSDRKMETEVINERLFFKENPFLLSFIAGGCCGLAVDSILFPIDTCKTRLQSEAGFWKSGGFKGIYNGIVPVLAGSVPTASLFFSVYYLIRSFFQQYSDESLENDRSFEQFLIVYLVSLLAASVGEMFADLVRVPVEIVKQKHQVSEVRMRATDILLRTYRTEGLFNGVYRGYGVTIMRDIPFSAIQYPLQQTLKDFVLKSVNIQFQSFVSACCGTIAGAIAAGATTPLDAAKTRIQLADNLDDPNGYDDNSTRNPISVWRTLYKEGGIPSVFSGFIPRVLWTAIGGFIWFGTYSTVEELLLKI